jgi:hypothetical protein
MGKASRDLAALIELVPPPPRPTRIGDPDNCTRLLEAVDFKFPVEFLQYGRLYGTGEMAAGGYVLRVANPLDPVYPKWIRTYSDAMRTRGDGPDRRTTRFYPEPRGVVPFAVDLSGDLIFFSPHRGTARVVTCPTGDPNDLVAYPLTFAKFLVTLFTGKLNPEWFPNREVRGRALTFKKRAWLK